MFFNEHNPLHFYAKYGEYRVVVNLNDEVVNGFMPKRTLNLIFEWLEELLNNWKKYKNDISLNKINTLK